ncbi:hypothetical protein R3P38DRAFT_2782437 [Favolaschia claudopus]|uniref:Uncharacterized protein n=1 Tax=Favolaschia claudopus TaxID=2862362 RepID=A0AAW0B3J9_9AGAR
MGVGVDNSLRASVPAHVPTTPAIPAPLVVAVISCYIPLVLSCHHVLVIIAVATGLLTTHVHLYPAPLSPSPPPSPTTTSILSSRLISTALHPKLPTSASIPPLPAPVAPRPLQHRRLRVVIGAAAAIPPQPRHCLPTSLLPGSRRHGVKVGTAAKGRDWGRFAFIGACRCGYAGRRLRFGYHGGGVDVVGVDVGAMWLEHGCGGGAQRRLSVCTVAVARCGAGPLTMVEGEVVGGRGRHRWASVRRDADWQRGRSVERVVLAGGVCQVR